MPHNTYQVFTLRRLIFSPGGAMIIFTSVAVFAMITFYSLSFLKNYLDSGTRHAIVIEHPNPVPGNEGSFPDADDVPPPPGALSSPNQNQSSNNLGQGKTPMPLSNKKTTPVKTKVFKAPEFKFLPSLKTYIPKNLQKSEKTIPEPAQKNISIKKNTTAPPVTSRIPAPLKKKAKAPVKSSFLVDTKSTHLYLLAYHKSKLRPFLILRTISSTSSSLSCHIPKIISVFC